MNLGGERAREIHDFPGAYCREHDIFSVVRFDVFGSKKCENGASRKRASTSICDSEIHEENILTWFKDFILNTIRTLNNTIFNHSEIV